MQIGENLTGDPGSEEALSRMRQLVSTCEQAHPQCHQERPFLPKRLPAIDEADATNIYLWEPEKGSCGRYATLSYCWGGENSIKTTTAPHIHPRDFARCHKSLASIRNGIQSA